MIINFMCIGVGRSGTTWIYKLLDSHKDISMALGKETNYFNNFYRSRSIDWYHEQFSTKKDYKSFGEVSNNYYFNEGIAERIFKYNPKTKLIFCIREPVDLLLTIKSFADRRSLRFHSVEDFLQTPIVNIMGQSDIAIANLSVSRPTLDDVFLKHTGRSIRDEEASGGDGDSAARQMLGLSDRR